jgi:hypothetical protein
MKRGYGELRVSDQILEQYRQSHEDGKCAANRGCTSVVFCAPCYTNWYSHQKPLVQSTQMLEHLCVYWTATLNGLLTHNEDVTEIIQSV